MLRTVHAPDSTHNPKCTLQTVIFFLKLLTHNRKLLTTNSRQRTPDSTLLKENSWQHNPDSKTVTAHSCQQPTWPTSFTPLQQAQFQRMPRQGRWITNKRTNSQEIFACRHGVPDLHIPIDAQIIMKTNHSLHICAGLKH